MTQATPGGYITCPDAGQISHFDLRFLLRLSTNKRAHLMVVLRFIYIRKDYVLFKVHLNVI